MQFPESWLREFCDPSLSTREIADALTMAGMEVEELRPVAPAFSGVVVGEIKACATHPNADRLKVCQVDVGGSEMLNIVCGAPNARVGIRVPCALVGAELPPGDDGVAMRIGLGKLRGVESQGMLCSARELKLSEDHAGLLELDGGAPVGQDIRKVLALDDHIFTLKLTPNLAHALSVQGVARELSALTGAPLRQLHHEPVSVGNDARLAVRIEAPDLCGRFSGRVIRNVNTQASTPRWMVDRLARCGQRSVSALVDISNYVMFELGRPSHIFDFDRIHGALQVRWGRAGEHLKLLNGSTIKVDANTGVIADDVQVESLAGIMGGDSTAVNDDTRNVYVEAAFWWPQAVQGRARKYNFSTDAGHRFERGVDPSLTVEHIERISRLILDICGGDAGPMDDQITALPEAKPVTLRVARAAKVIGMPLDQAACADALRRLGLPLVLGKGTIVVTPPPYRFDLQIEEDLIEEVARIIGYDKLPTTAPLAPTVARIRAESRRSVHQLRRSLASLGYHETINFSFVEERWERELAGQADPIRLLNPIASQMSVMRSSLLGSLVEVLRYNLDRKAERVRVFEVGRVFRREPGEPGGDATVKGIHQPMHVAALAYGPADARQWSTAERASDFFDIKGDLQALLSTIEASFEPGTHPAMHPGRCARVRIAGVDVGVVGELHPRWRQTYELPGAPVLFELALDALLQRPVPGFTPVSRFQAAERDLALVVREGVTHAALMKVIHGTDTGGLLREANLFDIYRPKQASAQIAVDEKSLAVRLTLGSNEATLTETQIEQAVQAVLEQLRTQLGARLRA